MRPRAGATLRAACWLLAACCLPGLARGEAAGQGVDPLSVTELGPGVFVHVGAREVWSPASRGDVANLGFIVGSRCVAVVDTGGTPAVGKALRTAIERATPLPVCYVISTHAHPDHVLGNVAFAEADPPPQFVGHAKLAAALTARGPFYLRALERDFGVPASRNLVVYPGVQVSDVLELDLGDRVLELRAWPSAHTDHDLTVYDRRTRTLFLSDLLFVEHIPVLDGKLAGWLAVMATLQGLEVAHAVPGHGPVSGQWPMVMKPQEDYLSRLLHETRRAIKDGLTIRQAVERVGGDAPSRWLLADEFHRRNVTAAYAELEWEE